MTRDGYGPQNLTDFGLTEDIQKLDAAFVWGKNEKTYFFRSNLYWRYDEMLQKMDEGYPKGVKFKKVNFQSPRKIFSNV